MRSRPGAASSAPTNVALPSAGRLAEINFNKRFPRGSFTARPMDANADGAFTARPANTDTRGSFTARLTGGSWRQAFLPFAALLLLAAVTQAEPPGAAKPLRVVIVGGGPKLDYNQAAIESNVRYVGKCLPPGIALTTLFADGNINKPTVQIADEPADWKPGERLLDLALRDADESDAPSLHYRKPNLGVKLDGPATPNTLTEIFSEVVRESAAAAPKPLLLYFTGHGGPDHDAYKNNVYSMWGDRTLSTRQLARQMARLPETVPVTLVMAQCFSGSFGNLIFAEGVPDGKPVAREFAGFFASQPDRMAAGCTAETNEAEYRDFTSYFFAALTGRDRVGRKVTGADYNSDGRVGMDEAFCYTLANDRSIDTPVCTSDIFLRRFAPVSEKERGKVPFHSVQEWATPAQRYALDALAKSLHRDKGENRLALANLELNADPPKDAGPNRRERKRTLDELRTEAQRSLLARWPDLRDSTLPDYALAKTQALKYLIANENDAKWKALRVADDALLDVDAADEAREIAEAHLVRFVALGNSIIRAHHLRQTASAVIKARFARLLQAEAGSPLPPVVSAALSTH